MGAGSSRSPHRASILAEAASGLSREILEGTLDLLPFPALLIEPGSARVIFANRAADDLAGGEFPKAAEADAYEELYVLTDEAGVPIPRDEHPGVRAARGERIVNCQVCLHLPAGPRSLLVSGDLVPATPEREELVVMAFEDITAIKDAEAAAREATTLLDTFFESAPVGMAYFDDQLRFLRVNAALARMNGVPADAHVGRTVADVLPGQDPVMEHLLRLALDTGDSVEREVSGTTPAAPGRRRHWLVGVYPVRLPSGEVTGVGATITDISERVANEERATFLARAGEVLGRSLDFETTLRDAASIAVPDLADWCIIDMLEAGGEIKRVAVANSEPEKQRQGWELSKRYPPRLENEGVLTTVLRTGQPLVVPEVDEEMLRAGARDAEHLQLLRSLGVTGGVAVPLVVRGRVIGAVTFAFTDRRRRPGEMDVELAGGLAKMAASAIDNARLYADRSHIARTLQRSLLPPRLPRIEGFEIAARYRAAGEGNEVGGDFYDVFQRTDSSWIVALGDVCGKGAEAAALTALARFTLRAAAISDGSPETLLGTLNEAILREHDGRRLGDRFMTAVTGCLDLDPKDPSLTIGAGGHPPPLLVRAGGTAEALEIGGRALGLLPGAVIGRREVTLGHGDALLLYTDGVLDAGAPRRPLSIDDLLEVAAGASELPAARTAELVERTAMERSNGTPRDDIAIVVLRRDGVGRG
jgi:PAS domain S-box-containing protein